MTLTQLIEAAEREVKQRERVYPRLIEAKKMSQAKADHELAAMQEIAAALRRLQDNMPLFRKLAEMKQILDACPEAQTILDAFPGAEVRLL